MVIVDIDEFILKVYMVLVVCVVEEGIIYGG